MITVTHQVYVEGEPRSVSERELTQLARRFYDELVGSERVYMTASVRLGVILLQAKRVHAGRFIAWLREAGINLKRAERAMKVAIRCADAHGELDVDRLFQICNRAFPERFPARESFQVRDVTGRLFDSAIRRTRTNAPVDSTRASNFACNDDADADVAEADEDGGLDYVDDGDPMLPGHEWAKIRSAPVRILNEDDDKDERRVSSSAGGMGGRPREVQLSLESLYEEARAKAVQFVEAIHELDEAEVQAVNEVLTRVLARRAASTTT